MDKYTPGQYLQSLNDIIGRIADLRDKLVGKNDEAVALIDDFMDDPCDIKKRSAISDQRFFYEQCGQNIMHACKAIEIANQYGLPVPVWASSALVSRAPYIAALNPDKKSRDSDIKQALGLDAKKISQFHANMKKLDDYFKIRSLVNSGMALNAAIEKIAYKQHLTFETLERHYYEMDCRGKSIPTPDPFSA